MDDRTRNRTMDWLYLMGFRDLACYIDSVRIDIYEKHETHLNLVEVIKSDFYRYK